MLNSIPIVLIISIFLAWLIIEHTCRFICRKLKYRDYYRALSPEEAASKDIYLEAILRTANHPSLQAIPLWLYDVIVLTYFFGLLFVPPALSIWLFMTWPSLGAIALFFISIPISISLIGWLSPRYIYSQNPYRIIAKWASDQNTRQARRRGHKGRMTPPERIIDHHIRTKNWPSKPPQGLDHEAIKELYFRQILKRSAKFRRAVIILIVIALIAYPSLNALEGPIEDYLNKLLSQ